MGYSVSGPTVSIWFILSRTDLVYKPQLQNYQICGDIIVLLLFFVILKVSNL